MGVFDAIGVGVGAGTGVGGGSGAAVGCGVGVGKGVDVGKGVGGGGGSLDAPQAMRSRDRAVSKVIIDNRMGISYNGNGCWCEQDTVVEDDCESAALGAIFKCFAPCARFRRYRL